MYLILSLHNLLQAVNSWRWYNRGAKIRWEKQRYLIRQKLFPLYYPFLENDEKRFFLSDLRFYKTASSSVLFHLLILTVVTKLRHKTLSPSHFPLDLFSLDASIPVQHHRSAHWETLWLLLLVRKRNKGYCHIFSPSQNKVVQFCIHVQRENRRNYGFFLQQTKK